MSGGVVESADDFRTRVLPHLGKRVMRLGLALNMGVDEAAAAAAIDRGVNYLFWPAHKKMSALLRERLKRDRERLVVATGPTLGYFGGSVRRAADKALKLLDTDYIDVFQLFWLGRASAWTQATIDELVKLRESGKVRAIGVSIHDRPRAGRLAEDSPLDLFMIRYNAAHPGAEKDIFPHLGKRRPAVVAYTATAWRRLLRAPSAWKGEVPSASHCYRFCLSSPFVDVTLTGPKDAQQLEENLAALERGPLSAEEDRWLRDFGRVVHDRSSKLVQRV
jgi:aryl-alcohol dehydrogenase-like predicted oxidoreductase